MCVCVRAHPEKLEPLLESGHDLAVTHRERERESERERRDDNNSSRPDSAK